MKRDCKKAESGAKRRVSPQKKGLHQGETDIVKVVKSDKKKSKATTSLLEKKQVVRKPEKLGTSAKPDIPEPLILQLVV